MRPSGWLLSALIASESNLVQYSVPHRQAQERVGADPGSWPDDKTNREAPGVRFCPSVVADGVMSHEAATGARRMLD